MTQVSEFKVEVLNIPLYARDIDSAVSVVLTKCSDKSTQNRCISATGAHGLVYSKKNPEFRQALLRFYLNLPDGMPGVWVGWMKGAKEMKRCYGPDFFKAMMISSKNSSVKHFFCGGNPGVAEDLKASVAKKFNNSNVVDVYCPPFLPIEKYDYGAIAEQINNSKANVVWIGLSTPKQELFAMNLSQKTNVNFLITVGAAFDFHTDRIRQAPKLIQQAGLEWLFRLLGEPKRLYKRYLEVVPYFIYYNIVELLKFATLKKNTP